MSNLLSPLDKLNLELSHETLNCLNQKGIVVLAQLVENLRERTDAIEKLVGRSANELLGECETRYAEYTYEQCLRNESIEPYKGKAKRYQIRNYLDLLVEPEHRSVVIKATLSGMLSKDLTPRPVSVSVAVHQSLSLIHI